MQKDYAFQMGSSNLRFGPGVTREVGMDLADMGVRRVLVFTDPNLKDSQPMQTVSEALKQSGIDFDTLFGCSGRTYGHFHQSCHRGGAGRRL